MMQDVKWTEAMSVGVPALDKDHQILVDLIQQVRPQGSSAQDSRDTISRTLVRLIAYTEHHFYREERVMEACGYPGMALHQEEHRELEGEVQEFYRRFMEGDEAVTLEALRHFLVGWLNHHILLNDMHYRRYCEGNPEADRVVESFGPLDGDGPTRSSRR